MRVENIYCDMCEKEIKKPIIISISSEECGGISLPFGDEQAITEHIQRYGNTPICQRLEVCPECEKEIVGFIKERIEKNASNQIQRFSR